jgi:long-chain fatty acid transport protein
VVESHLTLGATWAMGTNGELTVMYMHAFEKEVSGSGSIPMAFGGGEANLHMSQDSLGVGYGIKF